MTYLILNRFTRTYRISEDNNPRPDEQLAFACNMDTNLGEHLMHETIANLEKASYVRYDLPEGYVLISKAEFDALKYTAHLFVDDEAVLGAVAGRIKE